MTNDCGTYVACFNSKDGSAIDDITLVATPARARVFISEVAVPAAPNAEYVELYNTTLHPMTLVDMSVEVFSGGSTTPRLAAIPDGLVIPAATPGTVGTCQFTIVSDAAAFEDAFPGSTFDAEVPSLQFDGTDVIALFFGDELIDVYGVIGVDGSGAPWQLSGQSAERNVEVTTPSTTMALSDWTLSSTFTPDFHVHP